LDGVVLIEKNDGAAALNKINASLR